MKWFNESKGFGFVTAAVPLPGHQSTELFVHFSEIQGEGFKVLREGENVTFLVGKSEKGPQAMKVKSKGTFSPVEPSPPKA